MTAVPCFWSSPSRRKGPVWQSSLPSWEAFPLSYFYSAAVLAWGLSGLLASHNIGAQQWAFVRSLSQGLFLCQTGDGPTAVSGTTNTLFLIQPLFSAQMNTKCSNQKPLHFHTCTRLEKCIFSRAGWKSRTKWSLTKAVFFFQKRNTLQWRKY